MSRPTSLPRAFIIPGDISHLGMFARHVPADLSGILLHQRGAVPAADLARIGLSAATEKTWTLDTLDVVAPGPATAADQSAYADLLATVLADPRTHYLATRTFHDSPFNNAIAIERIVLNCLRLIRTSDPSILVASSTPHSIEAWILAKCFERLGLAVYILESTPIAFRSWLYRGLDTQGVVSQPGDPGGARLSDATRDLVHTQRDSRPGARDAAGYHLSRIYLNSIEDVQTNRWWSHAREAKWLWSGPLRSLPVRAYSVARKRRLYRSYRRVQIRSLPPEPFVVYFMHFQPERSSLPVGRTFSQQWFAMRALSWALPRGWKLLVREHPTTWLKPLDPFVRTPSIYEDIASLPNTHVCAMEIDTFELIDASRAVATLTGSVGFQSLVRGRPVLAFGLAPYKDHPACYPIESSPDAARALGAVASGESVAQLTQEALTAYLEWIERNSVSADPSEGDWMKARLKNFAEIYRRLFEGELALDPGMGTRHAGAAIG